jgi:hypothetical protein
VGCGSLSSVATVNLGGKKEGETLGLSFDRSGPSYATVVSSTPGPAAKVTPILVKVIPLVVPLDLDKPLCPMGKQLRSPRFSARGGAFPDRGSFLNLNLHTWRNLLVSLYLALGRVFGKRLGRSSGSRNGLFCKGLRLGRFLPRPKPKPKVLHQPKILVCAILTTVRGSLLRPEISTVAWGGSGGVKLWGWVVSGGRTRHASLLYRFPPFAGSGFAASGVHGHRFGFG